MKPINCNISRRELLRSACATAALCGMPARIWGAAGKLGKPDLVIGLLSDIHIQLPPTVQRAGSLERFRHALEYFRDRHVDGVLVSGDLANAGLETELKAVADAWFSTFPGGRLPDGSPVANLMHYGDHDTEARFYKDSLKAKFTAAGLPVPRSLSEGEYRKEIWEALFHEPWSPVRHVKVKGFDFVLSNFMREGGKSAPDDLESQLRSLNIDPAKPFFYSQHRWIQGTYLADEEMWGSDNGVTHKVLPKFPNAIAFQGHTHYMLTDDRGVWIGDFISINNGSLLNQASARMRENGTDISWYKNDYMLEKQMKHLDHERGHAGMVMSVYGDLVVLERRDFGCDLPLGPDLVFSADPKLRAANSNAARKQASIAPEFAHGASVAVADRTGEDRQGRATEQTVVTFPTVNAAEGRPRAYEYLVRAEDETGRTLCDKRVHSPGINLPESKDDPFTVCVFAKRELAAPAVRFVVRPANCWGTAGRPIVSELWKNRG